MFKKITIGLLAAAATSTLVLATPAAAASGPYDQSDHWGSVYAKHHLAKATGWVGVEWDEDQESNTVHVKGKLYDKDARSYAQGGKCAYVKFQAADFDHDWDEVYSKKYCGYPGHKKFGFSVDDVSALRVKVCQVHPHKHWVSKCGHWAYLYAAESE
ncbi:hypothetical protein [Nonomuraea sp. SBT364]|uniref:hypothetical protein n=1 Tax=Nonomuraea sp. SBT364 TaxID=1580530 RepID=UPI00066DBAD2|nr:hypothetical protein [Nonomuraea sp. SBT364]